MAILSSGISAWLRANEPVGRKRYAES